MQIDSLSNQTEQNKSHAKKFVLIGLILSLILLLILLILLIVYVNNIPHNLTLVIDGQAKEYTEDTFIFEDNKIYVSLKDIANSIGYRYYDGGYKQYTQDKTTCYLECDDEIVVYELGKDKINKALADGNIQYSEFEIFEPVRQINDKLYVIASGLEVGCNIDFSYNQNTNQLVINTLSSLYTAYNDKAIAQNYLNVDGTDEDFENKKTILYNMLVVTSTIKGQKKYGVISLDGSVTYLDIKYDEIKFIENLQYFLVKGDNKYGVMSKDGKQIINLEYDKITVIDGINNLYYVEKNGKKGIFDENGKVLGGNLYVQYDEIGVNKTIFTSDNIENSMIIYNKCIPARMNDKWGVFDIEGNLISNFEYDSLGYIDPERKGTNILLIEDIEGIVVCKEGKYGVIDSKGNLLVTCAFDKIYSETVEGEEKYYIQYGDQSIEIHDYLE